MPATGFNGTLSKPTAPRWLAILARCCSLTLVVVIGHWVESSLAGVSVTDSNGIFNWHPVLMTLAFVVFMTEALLAYKAPITLAPLSRPYSKLLHWTCNACAVTCIAFGLIAVFKFHAMKHFADLYSPHSFLGILTSVLVGLQFLLGFLSYLWPKAQPRQRAAFGPLHAFLGLFTWSVGLATIATGLQEKVAFIQGSLPGGLFSAAVRLPASALLLLALLAAIVHFIHAFYAPASPPGAAPPTITLGGGSGDARLLEGMSSLDSMGAEESEGAEYSRA